MISQITIKDVATYDNSVHSINGLSKLNFIFGSNGSGKTTISRILANSDDYPSCTIQWTSKLPLNCTVYNIDYIEANFIPNEDLPGIFTLGQTQGDILEKINDLSKEVTELTLKKTDAKNTLFGIDGKSGKNLELNNLKATYIERFWEQKKEHESTPLKHGLSGYRGSREKFFDEMLLQYQENNAELLTFEDLSEKAAIVFSQNLEAVPEISIPDFSRLISLNNSSILRKNIIGKDDVAISDLIKRLHNSDWVKEGMSYLDSSDGLCPFCQQPLLLDFKHQLEEFFDESYNNDLTTVENLLSDYKSTVTHIKNDLAMIEKNYCDFIDINAYKEAIKSLNEVSSNNITQITEKLLHPSQIISLNDLSNEISNLMSIFNEADNKIQRHNAMVYDINRERERVKKQTWKYITHKAERDIVEYINLRSNLTDEITKLEQTINNLESNIFSLNGELEHYRSQLTSIIPIKDSINNYLKEFGFTGFHLEVGDNDQSYSIVRDDGKRVEKTLSEGEKNFVTFLYFFSSLNGSLNSSGQIQPQIVVIDDPVSSMDSDVLFIVSSLIRSLYENICQGSSAIKQLFVLSHNTYFFKEVAWDKGLHRSISKNMRYWIVTKRNGQSNIISQEKCPVKSTYESLWDEVRSATQNPANTDCHALQNTLRRILEHYYTYYGGISLNNVPKEFPTDQRVIARSLISWINDGSHSKFDDTVYTPPTENSIKTYLDIFKKIFEKTNQLAHYNLMMGSDEND